MSNNFFLGVRDFFTNEEPFDDTTGGTGIERNLNWKGWALIILIVISFLGIFGMKCVQSQSEQKAVLVENVNNIVGGTYSVKDLRTVTGIEYEGQASGFIFFWATIDGEKQCNFQFAWENTVEGRPSITVISTISAKLLVFMVIDDDSVNYQGPTIKFDLEYPDNVDPEIDFNNPNSVLDNFVKMVTITISKSDFNSFMAE